MTGAFTDYRAFSDDEKAIFDKAIASVIGVSYKPLLLATQVVAGTNYKFLCEAKVTHPDAEAYYAEVVIYQPLEGDLALVSITRFIKE